MIIAVDGPLASGKGTIARALAERFGLPYLDTGSLYRATAVALLDAGQDTENEDAAEAAARALDIASIDEGRIRTAEAGIAASKVAAQPRVRAALLDLQRDFAHQPGGAILDGRDIGTVICPEADVKFYVTASQSTRAERRWKELTARGETISLDEVLEQTVARDDRDQARMNAPLRPAEDARLLDTTDLSIDAAVAEAVAHVENRR